MRTLVATAVLVVLLLLTALVFALAGGDTGARIAWQGSLIVAGIGIAAWALRFVPEGPWGVQHVEGTIFDDPDSFWGRAARIYRQG